MSLFSKQRARVGGRVCLLVSLLVGLGCDDGGSSSDDPDMAVDATTGRADVSREQEDTGCCVTPGDAGPDALPDLRDMAVPPDAEPDVAADASAPDAADVAVEPDVSPDVPDMAVDAEPDADPVEPDVGPEVDFGPPPECEEAEDCDDQNACTRNRCLRGVCNNAPRRDCCTDDSECPDSVCLLGLNECAPIVQPGQVVITELAAAPSEGETAQWIEITNRGNTSVYLDNWSLEGTPGEAHLIRPDEPLELEPFEYLLLAASGDRADNGGIDPHYVYEGFSFAEGTDRVALYDATGTLVDEVIYRANWPLRRGATLSLSAERTTAARNDEAESWCTGENPWRAGGDRGSPGEINPFCGQADTEVDACRLVNPLNFETGAGTQATYLGRVREAGLTDLSPGVDPDPLLIGQVGWGAEGSEPSADWTWSGSEPNERWMDAVERGFDEYIGRMEVPGRGTYAAGWRFSRDGGQSWRYCEGRGVLVSVMSNCDPNPCNEPPANDCPDPFTARAFPAEGTCVDRDEARCTYAERLFDCAADDLVCRGGACLAGAPRPQAGDIVFSEVAYDPEGGLDDDDAEWFELQNTTGRDLRLDGCRVEDASGRQIISRLPLRADAAVLLVRNADPEVNGGLEADHTFDFNLSNEGETLRLLCGDTLIDQIAYDDGGEFPAARSGAIALDAFAFDAADNDDGASWCLAEAIYFGEGQRANRGTPGVTNPPCPGADTEIDWCNLEMPLEVEAGSGTAVQTWGRVREQGITDDTEGTDVHPDLVAEVGFGAAGSEPGEDWIWTAGEADPLWDSRAARELDVDQYQASFVVPAPGDYDFAWRFSRDGGGTWTYCDREAGSRDGYAAEDAGHLSSVAGPCAEAACDSPAEPDCLDAQTRRTYGLPGLCEVEGQEAVCGYAEATQRCDLDGGRCADGVCVDGEPHPAPGEVVFSEVLYDPHGALSDLDAEWFELRNTAEEARTLNGCVVDGRDGEVQIEGLVLQPGDHVLFARSEEGDLNGGLAPDHLFDFDLLNEGDILRLRCGEALVDQFAYDDGVTFPDAFKASLSFDGSTWCLGQGGYFGQGEDTHRGSPGEANPACPDFDGAVDLCRIIDPAREELGTGQEFVIRGMAQEAGITDRSQGPDLHPLLVVQAGVGPSDTQPDASWSWTRATPDADYRHAEHDEYTATLRAPGDPGGYDAAIRVSVDGGETWTNCDLGEGSADGYQPQQATQLLVRPAASCNPNPCLNPPAPRCGAPGTRVVADAVGDCALDRGVARCNYNERQVPCDGDAVCADGLCFPADARSPRPGEVLITEIMADPHNGLSDADAEWFELRNTSADRLTLHGCAVSDANSNEAIAGVWLEAGAHALFARSADPALNGGLEPDGVFGFTLDNDADTLSLRCGNLLIDTVAYDAEFPAAERRAIQIDAGVDADSNDGAGAWCLARLAYLDVAGQVDDHFGTPGQANPPCPDAQLGVDFCRLEMPEEAELETGATLQAFATVRQAGITDRSDRTDPDPTLLAQIGFAPEAEADQLRWVAADPDFEWDASAEEEPDLDQYVGELIAPEPGEYIFAFRFSADDGESWTQCDLDPGSLDGFAGRDAGRLVVVEARACEPNPCRNPPAPACDGNTRLTYAAVGECREVDGEAVCDYEGQRTPCAQNEVCRGGACVPEDLPNPLPGEVIFTELLYNPEAPLAETDAEWFELHNTGDRELSLHDCTLADAAGDFTRIAGLRVAAGGYLLFARSLDPAANGGLDAHHAFGFALDNEGDTLSLRCGGGLIDALRYDAGGEFPRATARSLRLDPERLGAVANDEGLSWCLGEAIYFDFQGEAGDHRGSPGEANGACPAPCDPNPCDSPPPTGCDPDGRARLVYAAQGQCEADGREALCDYGADAQDCGAGEVCRLGECVEVDDVCAPNPCVNPGPAECADARTLRTFTAPGACADEDGPSCTYEERLVDCGAGGCAEGECVELPDPCEAGPCEAAPPPRCTPNADAVVLSIAPGACQAVGGNALCDFEEDERACARGEACVDGECLEVDDVCDPNPCQAPPANECADGDTVRERNAPGQCQESNGRPECSYPANERDCAGGERCEAGRCVDDPCAPNPCDAPPAERCAPDGRGVLSFAAQGACAEVGGEAACDYDEQRVDCDPGEVCQNAACVPVQGDPCDPNPCQEPPAEECGPDGVSRLSYIGPGVCEPIDGAPDCSYEQRRTACADGDVCREGRCVPVEGDPCDPNPCLRAPDPGCAADGSTRLIYEGAGVCANVEGRPECNYEPEEQACGAGEVCREGACELADDVCRPNPCQQPPEPSCSADGRSRISFRGPGQCADEEGRPACEYERIQNPCANDETCRDGECVEAGQACVPDPCDVAPPPACSEDGTARIVYADGGTCEERLGAPHCDFESAREVCDQPPAEVCAPDARALLTYAAIGRCLPGDEEATCDYAEARVACGPGQACRDARCVDVAGDPCADNPCQNPPDEICSADQRSSVAFQGPGTCEVGADGGPECRYDRLNTDCAPEETCVDGACRAAPDACDPNPCVDVPEDACAADGVSVVRFGAGRCSEPFGELSCDYPREALPCEPGQVCRDARCVAGGGDLCDPNPCQNAPAPRCEGDALVVSSGPGLCGVQDGAPSCSYEERREACLFGCAEGACVVPDPCEGQACEDPAPRCAADARSLIVPGNGRCVAVDGAPQCEFRDEHRACADDELCLDGQCQPVGADPCDPNPCVEEVEPACDPDGRAVVLAVFPGECEAREGLPVCRYEPRIQDCPEGEVCIGGECAREANLCDPNPCQNPPVAGCSGDAGARLVYEGAGNCRIQDGQASCDYVPERIACAAGQLCARGECVDAGEDPCDPNPCQQAPEAACEADGRGRVIYAAQGECVALDDAPRCFYPPQREACAADERCVGGECRVVPPDACADDPCGDAPPPRCAPDAVSVIEFSAPGRCEDVDDQAICEFDQARVACDGDEICRQGECVPAGPQPCEPNPCQAPPGARCGADGLRVISLAPGNCVELDGQPFCDYEAVPNPCLEGRSCEDGECVHRVDACDPNPCDEPPPVQCAADGRSLLRYGLGACEQRDFEAECTYLPERVVCAADEICLDARCVPAGEDPCDPNPCQEAPEPACTPDGSGRVVALRPGVCQNDNGAPRCLYPSDVEPCGADQRCVAGACEDLPDPCAPNPCDEPGPVLCGPDGQSLLVPDARGVCRDVGGQADCDYGAQRQACELGEICLDGNCVDLPGGPCEVNPCQNPPPPGCAAEGETIVRFGGPGQCFDANGAPECRYEREELPCDGELVCENGECVPPRVDPCADDPCGLIPPPACAPDGTTIIEFSGPAQCLAAEGRPVCIFNEAQTPCEQGQRCLDGVCEEAGADPCEPNPCVNAPRAFCDFEGDRQVGVSPGRCQEMAGAVMCDYDLVAEACDPELRCEQGVCVEVVPLVCDPNPCEEPPEDRCVDVNTLLQYADLGACREEGFAAACEYEAQRVLCADDQVCRDGACVEAGANPCAPNPCVDAPEPSCAQDGRGVIRYDAPGECAAIGGRAACGFTPSRVNCANDEICWDGACLPEALLCLPNPCDDPPANACDEDGRARLIFGARGDCSVVNGQPGCDYEPEAIACADNEICRAGDCVPRGADVCQPNPCQNPPEAGCNANANARVVYDAPGLCRDIQGDPSCSYEPLRLDCADDELCRGGECVPQGAGPCDPNPCIEPPRERCAPDGVSVLITQPVGRCGDDGGEALCVFDEVRVLCELGQVCEAGQCRVQAEACAPNPCQNPPADECEGDRLVSFEGPGRCLDFGGQPLCDYAPSVEDCPQGQACRGGACQPVGGEVCDPNPCREAPEAQCDADGQTRLVPAVIGQCREVRGEASCEYPIERVVCEEDEVCLRGLCVLAEEPCDPNPCLNAPADRCNAAGARVVASAPGQCLPDGEGHQCRYVDDVVPCDAGEICQEGACVPEGGPQPCDPNPCQDPPAQRCSEDARAVVNFAPLGACSPDGDDFDCDYDRDVRACDADEVCRGGACEPAGANACQPNPCENPPEPACELGNRARIRFEGPGACALAEDAPTCTYEPVREACDAGSTCEDGVCRRPPPDLCDPNPCDAPPADTCQADATTAVRYEALGSCSQDGLQIACDYVPNFVACNVNELCIEGECVPRGNDPCALNPCRVAPDPECDFQGERVTFEAPGDCDVLGGQVQCNFEREVRPCAGGLICRNGECVDAGEVACNPNPCNDPPEARCDADGVTVLGFPELGICDGGGAVLECAYPPSRQRCPEGNICVAGACIEFGANACDPNPCENSPDPICSPDGATRITFAALGDCQDLNGQPQCTYGRIEEGCPLGQRCRAGACEEVLDPCDPDPCQDPPRDRCAPGGRAVLVAQGAGVCRVEGDEAACDFVDEAVACGAEEICNDGECVDAGQDPCDPNPCVNAPAPVCLADGQGRQVPQAPGRCVLVEGRAECLYEREDEACPGDEICEAGRCALAPADACHPNPCDAAPADRCTADARARVVFPAEGACAVGELDQAICAYPPREVECAPAERCLAGDCVPRGADPCEPNPCVNGPAPVCADAGRRIVSQVEGLCEVLNEQIICDYGEVIEACDPGTECRNGICGGAGGDPCLLNPCTEPPPARCDADGRTLIRFGALGECSDDNGAAACDYTPIRAACGQGEVCQEGACVAQADPCEPNPCGQAPEDACVAGDPTQILQHAAPGQCVAVGDAPRCFYPDQVVDCPRNHFCEAGVCERDPDAAACDPNPCDRPPEPTCSPDASSTVTYAALGQCAAEGGVARCDYAPVEARCAAGQLCLLGECVDAGADPCEPNPCRNAPESVCEVGGAAVVEYEAPGTCEVVDEAASCRYERVRVECLQGLECVNADCVEPAPDPCVPNPCDQVPAPECAPDGRSVRHFADGARCDAVDGRAVCDFPIDRVEQCAAGEVCQLGACQQAGADPCEPNPCGNAPEPRCSGDDVVVTPGAPGQCVAIDGEAACAYPEDRDQCAPDETCEAGRCVEGQAGPCVPNPCDAPPADRCAADGVTLITAGDGLCDVEGDQASCTYPEERAACPAGRLCRNGACEEGGANPCLPNPCQNPPLSACEAGGGAVIDYGQEGSCEQDGDAPVCTYTPVRTACGNQEICVGGECVPDVPLVCRPNPCQRPPEDACDPEGRLLRYPLPGACDEEAGEATCEYTPQTIVCPGGQTCVGGECVDEGPGACEPNPCDQPPAVRCGADAVTRLVPEAIGDCAVIGGQPICDYRLVIVECEDNEVCADGECVPAGLDPCDPNPCQQAPADECAGPDAFNRYESPGLCFNQDGRPICTYNEVQVDCGAEERCLDGECVPEVDPCDPNPCNEPPGAICNPDGSARVLSEGPGVCQVQADLAVCDYAEREVACPQGQSCLHGECVEDQGACEPNPCDAPPPPECLPDGRLRSFVEEGDCQVREGQPECEYFEQIGACEIGFACQAGECVEVELPAPTPGQVVFSEVMFDVVAPLGESDAEWFELYNASGTALNLQGCEVRGDAGATVLGGLTMGNAEYALLARSEGFEGNGGLDPDGVFDFTLGDRGDTLTLTCEGQVIDVLDYDQAFPLVRGFSINLDPPALDADANDSAENWCRVGNRYYEDFFGEGDHFGTPGQANPGCTAPVDDCTFERPAQANIDAAAEFTAYGRVLVRGITDASANLDPHPLLVGQLGVGPRGSDPEDNQAWTWSAAAGDPQWDGQAAGAFDFDEYVGTAVGPAQGQHSFTFRFSADGGRSWTYCDEDGAANGFDPAGTGELTTTARCVANTCDDPPADTCDGNTALSYSSPGDCAIEQGLPVCTYQENRQACGGQVCRAGLCADGDRQPVAGEVLFSEVFYNPAGELGQQAQWIEIYNPGAAGLNLGGCRLVSEGGESLIEPLPVPAGGRALLRRSANAGENGGLPPGALFDQVLTLGDTLGLRCDAGLIDALSFDHGGEFPAPQGGSISLDPASHTAQANDSGSNWCLVRAVFFESFLGDQRGTPGAANPPCDVAVDDCRLVGPVEADLVTGERFQTQGLVRIDGVTDESGGVDEDPLVRMEAGYGPQGSDPAQAAGWRWAAGEPDFGFDDGDSPDFDQYLRDLGIAEEGDYDLAWRASADGGRTWRYCDRDGGAYENPGALQVTLAQGPCEPNPCLQPPDPSCDPDGVTRVVSEGPGVCAVVNEQAECAYQEIRENCPDQGQGFVCQLGICLPDQGGGAPENPGDVVFSEVMYRVGAPLLDANAEWFELHNTTQGVLDLDGCRISDGNSELVLFAMQVQAGGQALFVRTFDNIQNGDLLPNSTFDFELADTGSLTLTCGPLEVDSVEWDDGGAFPQGRGASIALDPQQLDVDANDVGANWCLGRSAYFTDDDGNSQLGTPGEDNPSCSELADACNLAPPVSITGAAGTSANVFGRFVEQGLTDRSPQTDADPGVAAEFGYGAVGSDPSAGWSWTAGQGDGAWDGGAAGLPDTDQYSLSLTLPAPGIYDFAFRVSVDGGNSYRYCSQQPGDYDPQDTGEIISTDPNDPCSPNPCRQPPANECADGDTERAFPAVGACQNQAGQAACTYPPQLVNCGAQEACQGGGCRAPAAVPVPNDVVITEIQNKLAPPLGNASGQWIELHNPGQNALYMEGCTVENSSGQSTVLGDLVLEPDGYLVLGRSSNRQFNGDIHVDVTFAWLMALADTVRLRCNGQVVDQVTFDGGPNFPAEAGRAQSLNSANLDAQANDTGSSWCSALALYANNNYGTPGAANPECPRQVGFCRLQGPNPLQLATGGSETVYGRVFLAGVTDQSPFNDFDADLRGQLGVGPDGSDPAANPGAWTWTDGQGNFGYDGNAAGEPDNDEYQADISAEAGRFDYAWRFSADAGQTWVYCDARAAGSSDGYNPDHAGDLQVVAPPAPEAGQLVITEILYDPQDPLARASAQWIEIHNATDTALDLGGCVLTDQVGGGNSLVIADLVMVARGYSVFAGSVQFFDNGGVQAHQAFAFDLGQGDLVHLSCGGTVIDQVTYDVGGDFPTAQASSITLDPAQLDAAANNLGDNWCLPTETYFNDPVAPHRGSPGQANGICVDIGAVVDFCRHQSPDLANVGPGEFVQTFGRVFEPGITDQSAFNDDDAGAIQAEVGVGPDGSDPEANVAWVWTNAQPNFGYDGNAAGEPNNDEYGAQVSAPQDEGDYDIAYRFSIDGGITWLYCDGEAAGSSDGYQAANAGALSVVAGPCNPNPCDDPPAASCDGNVANSFGAGECEVVADQPECSYPPQITDCGAIGLQCVAGFCQ